MSCVPSYLRVLGDPNYLWSLSGLTDLHITDSPCSRFPDINRLDPSTSSFMSCASDHHEGRGLQLPLKVL